MAQRVVVEMVDDLDGTVGDDVSTVSFSLDGRAYEIDLCERNVVRLRSFLAEFVEAARTLRGGRAVKRGPGTGAGGDQVARTRTQVIREWASGAGLRVSGYGRISADVMRAYEQAHAVVSEPAAVRTQPKTERPKTERPVPAEGESAGGEVASLPSFSG